MRDASLYETERIIPFVLSYLAVFRLPGLGPAYTTGATCFYVPIPEHESESALSVPFNLSGRG